MGYLSPPPSKTGWGTPQFKNGWVTPTPSAKRAFATRRAVCLLHSRTRTFLFHWMFCFHTVKTSDANIANSGCLWKSEMQNSACEFSITRVWSKSDLVHCELLCWDSDDPIAIAICLNRSSKLGTVSVKKKEDKNKGPSATIYSIQSTSANKNIKYSRKNGNLKWWRYFKRLPDENIQHHRCLGRKCLSRRCKHFQNGFHAVFPGFSRKYFLPHEYSERTLS